MYRIFGVLAIIAAQTGCVSIENVPVESIVMVDGSGRLVDPSSNWLGMHSSLVSYPLLPKDEIDKYLDRVLASMFYETEGDYQRTGRRRIIVYIHGGLNTQVGSVEAATDIHDRISREPGAPFPLFFNWQSSLFSSYSDHLCCVRQGKKPPWGPLVAPIILAQDVLTTVVKAPMLWVYQLGHVANGLGFPSPDEEDAEKRRERRTDLRILSGEERRSAWDEPISMVSNVITFPIRFVTMPIVDVAGSSAWRNMLRRTTMLFHTEEEFTDECARGATGGLSLFLDRLRSLCSEDPEDFEITLVGHSMGAIVLNKILRRYPTLPIKNIVYMAAACSVRDYQDTVFPFLAREEHEDTEMFHLVLHEEAETDEVFWWYPEVAPRGSLLVWIDNFYEKPETWIDRTAGRWVNLMAGVHLRPRSIEDRVYIKKFDVGSEAPESTPQAHGEFGGFPFWERKFWWR